MPEPAYDSARSRIVLPDGEGPLDEYERWALVGVLVRALTHQHNPALVESALGGADSATDRVAAHRALLEGESLLIQSLYLGGLAPERMADLADQAMARAGADAHQAGAMVREVARFPLAAGSFLAVDLYRLGGPAALDQAMDMPPETTEQVLHIDRYRHLEPAVEVEPVRVVADGFLVAEEGVWGERRWRGLLGHHGEAMIAAEAAGRVGRRPLPDPVESRSGRRGVRGQIRRRFLRRRVGHERGHPASGHPRDGRGELEGGRYGHRVGGG